LTKIEENCDHNIDPRVTSFGEFSPIGRLFYLCSYLEIVKEANIFGYFFHGKSYVLVWVGQQFRRFVSQTHLGTLARLGMQ
jgi:hypothetical protein